LSPAVTPKGGSALWLTGGRVLEFEWSEHKNFKIVSGRLDFLVLFDQAKRTLFVCNSCILNNYEKNS